MNRLGLEEAPVVLSSANLHSFLTWARTASLDDVIETLEVVRITQHRDRCWDVGIAIHPTYVGRDDDEGPRPLRVKELECSVWNCHRCIRRRGGYDFRWVGPWTCPSLVGDDTTSAEELDPEA